MARGATLLWILMALAPATAQTEAELDLVHRMLDAFHGPDYTALAELVDFPRRAAERAARGLEDRPWETLDELERLAQVQIALRGWVTSERNFGLRATFVEAREVPDPDAGHGPVPDRRILQVRLRHQSSGEYRDMLLTLVPGPLVLDVEQGPVYVPGANPAGEQGLLPRAVFTVAVPLEVAWDPDLEPDERADVTGLVDALLAAPKGAEHRLARERLHRNPHAATAALLERLLSFLAAPPADEEAAPRLVEALEQITGRSSAWLAVSLPADDTGARDGLDPSLVQDWLRWHAANGWTFTPAPVDDPIEPTMAERDEPTEPLDMDRWTARLADQKARAEAGASAPPPGGTPPGPAAAPPAGPPPAPVPAAPPAPPSAPAPGKPAAPEPARPGPREMLYTAAADFSFRLRGREVTGREVEGELAPSLREALNAWAETCTRLKLTVVSSGHPEHLVVGRAPREVLEEAAEHLDRAAGLLDPCLPLVPPRVTRAVVAVIFDEEGVGTEAWGGLLDELVTRQVLFPETASTLRTAPAGLTRRQVPMFLQITAPLVLDPEFEYVNELVGKFTQCLATARVGELPRTVLWGLDYVAEQHFFQSIYQFDTTGFVFAADHFDWPVRTRQFLEKKEARDLSLAALALDDGAAGQPVRAQMVTWAVLAYLRDKQPETLAALLGELSAVQATADPRRRAAEWRGDRDQALATLTRTLETVDLRELADWLDRD